MRKKLILSLCMIVMASVALVGCKGEKGDKGDSGAQGIQGVQGVPGTPGEDGVTPTLEISNDGYWVINGTKTDCKAIGQDGEDGKNGANGTNGANGVNGKDGRGIRSVEYDGMGNLKIVYTDNTEQTVPLPDKEEHVHTYGDWTLYNIGADVSCTEKIYYSVCSQCNEMKWKKGAESHVWSATYTYDEYAHWYVCETCGGKTAREDHTLNDDKDCTVCQQHIGGVQYELSEDKTYAKVVGYDGLAWKATIEREYQGVPVTHVGEGAFMGNYTVSRVEFPDTITTIEDFAFFDSGLAYDPELPSSLTTIGEYAFAYCDGLGLNTSVKIPAAVTSIGVGAFDHCLHIELSIDENNRTYTTQNDGNILFSKDMTTLYWYNQELNIQEYAVPETVTKIASYAFAGNIYLHKVIIPASVTYIGANSFEGCKNLKSAVFGEVEGWRDSRKKDGAGSAIDPIIVSNVESAATLLRYSTYLKRTENEA
ncbi:MAG: collagen-like protein [Clostridia bacterium]|nr:collagen-like protein [Clostridia bacterium]